MENALLALDKATKLEPKSFEAQWKAARATRVARPTSSTTTRPSAQHFSGRGIDYAKAAIELDPKRVEGHYYSGNNLGLSASAKLVGAKFMVPSVRDAVEEGDDHRRAASITAGRRASSARCTRKAPPWPASIGDPDKGVELPGAGAQARAADYPQNNLFLGDALSAAEKYDEAKKQYQIVLDAQPRPEDRALPAEVEARWRRRASEDATREAPDSRLARRARD